ncbi:MAG: FMN-binding protein [Lachnospiraceae bacterium]|nr:FMN-binding protein [Lachnospiraceae bacterium]
MSKQSTVWQELLKPVVVLVCISLTAAVLLGFVNSRTKPIIEENARLKAEAVRAAVLAGAKGFEAIDCDTAALDIDSAYRETSGLGYVVTSTHRGYGGDVTVTVGLDAEGKIVGISADVKTETTGVGSRAGEAKYLDRFLGLTGDPGSVDSLTGATYTSTAVKNGVKAALAAFEKIR